MLKFFFAFLLRTVLTFHGCISGNSSSGSSRPEARSVASYYLRSSGDATERLAAAVKFSRPSTKQLLSMCKCPELFCEVLSSRVRKLPLKGNIRTALALQWKVRVTYTAYPILLQSVSIWLPLATFFLQQPGIFGKYLNWTSKKVVILSVYLN